ncbi:MAG: hypothetical protein ED555_09190 [Allomuricauda sp.]|nr:MAG: hypothetical protein ED555_09190 [Allomuricauda sp.]
MMVFLKIAITICHEKVMPFKIEFALIIHAAQEFIFNSYGKSRSDIYHIFSHAPPLFLRVYRA